MAGPWSGYILNGLVRSVISPIRPPKEAHLTHNRPRYSSHCYGTFVLSVHIQCDK